MNTRFKKNKFVIPVFFIMGLFLFSCYSANAESTGIDFQVGPVPSEKQLNKKVSYFDLQLNPKEETDIQVNIRNNTDRTIHIETYAATATTSDTGSVVYGHSNAKPDETLSYDVSSLITTAEKQITLTPKEQKIVSFHVKMPTDPFNGLLAGGLNFIELAEDIPQKKSKGTGVKNQYGYNIALILHGEANTLENDLTLGNVSLDQVNKRNVIQATLRNPIAAFLNRLSIHQKIYKQGQKKILYLSKAEMLQMAPNSKFDFATPLNGEKFKPGNYTLEIDAESKGKKWHFKQDFTIKSEEAKKYNEKDVSIKPDYTWLYISIGVLLLLLIFLIVHWCRNTNRKKQQEIQNN